VLCDCITSLAKELGGEEESIAYKYPDKRIDCEILQKESTVFVEYSDIMR